MSKASKLFNVLFLVGGLLITGLFMLFVSPEHRTPIAWLNFGVFMFIYIGFFGKYALLFPAVKLFADRTPMLAAYWKYFIIYVLVSCGSMLIFHSLELNFNQQLLLQGIFVFVFLLGLVFGMWLSEQHQRATEVDGRSMAGVRSMQRIVEELQQRFAIMPGEYAPGMAILNEVADEINTLVGSPSEDTQSADNQMFGMLTELKSRVVSEAAPGDIVQLLKKIKLEVALRKQMR